MYAHQVIEDYKWLLDKAQQNPRLTHAHKMSLRIGQNFTEKIKNAQMFNIASIEGLFEMGHSYKGRNLFMDTLAQFVRPPYEICWFDYSYPSENVNLDERASRRGILVFEVKEDLLNVFVYAFMDKMKRWVMGPQGYIISIGKPMSYHPDVVDFCNQGVALVSGQAQVPETKLQENIWIFPIQAPTYDLSECSTEDLKDLSALNCVLMLLNCKNIGTEKHDPPQALNKKRIKSGKQPLFTYHTLILKPMGKEEESVPKHLWHNRIHLQRGHFKTYSAEKPLFGHFMGRFWWQPHVRGKNRDGIVMKDYVIKPS